jgi:hypothetical protein
MRYLQLALADTLPELPNLRPFKAVASAYGWPADINDEQVLANLFEMNLEKSAGKNDLFN